MKKKTKIVILVIAIIIGALLFLGIDTSTEVIDDAWKLDGVILMQNTETGEIDCFGCNEARGGYALCKDPALGVEQIPETKERYCSNDFEVVESDFIECLPEQRNADACIQIYQPVCATVNVQCVTEPCNPVKETFSNSCHACVNELVEGYVIGECV